MTNNQKSPTKTPLKAKEQVAPKDLNQGSIIEQILSKEASKVNRNEIDWLLSKQDKVQAEIVILRKFLKKAVSGSGSIQKDPQKKRKSPTKKQKKDWKEEALLQIKTEWSREASLILGESTPKSIHSSQRDLASDQIEKSDSRGNLSETSCNSKVFFFEGDAEQHREQFIKLIQNKTQKLCFLVSLGTLLEGAIKEFNKDKEKVKAPLRKSSIESLQSESFSSISKASKNSANPSLHSKASRRSKASSKCRFKRSKRRRQASLNSEKKRGNKSEKRTLREQRKGRSVKKLRPAGKSLKRGSTSQKMFEKITLKSSNEKNKNSPVKGSSPLLPPLSNPVLNPDQPNRLITEMSVKETSILSKKSSENKRVPGSNLNNPSSMRATDSWRRSTTKSFSRLRSKKPEIAPLHATQTILGSLRKGRSQTHLRGKRPRDLPKISRNVTQENLLEITYGVNQSKSAIPPEFGEDHSEIKVLGAKSGNQRLRKSNYRLKRKPVSKGSFLVKQSFKIHKDSQMVNRSYLRRSSQVSKASIATRSPNQSLIKRRPHRVVKKPKMNKSLINGLNKIARRRGKIRSRATTSSSILAQKNELLPKIIINENQEEEEKGKDDKSKKLEDKSTKIIKKENSSVDLIKSKLGELLRKNLGPILEAAGKQNTKAQMSHLDLLNKNKINKASRSLQIETGKALDLTNSTILKRRIRKISSDTLNKEESQIINQGVPIDLLPKKLEEAAADETDNQQMEEFRGKPSRSTAQDKERLQSKVLLRPAPRRRSSLKGTFTEMKITSLNPNPPNQAKKSMKTRTKTKKKSKRGNSKRQSKLRKKYSSNNFKPFRYSQKVKKRKKLSTVISSSQLENLSSQKFIMLQEKAKIIKQNGLNSQKINAPTVHLNQTSLKHIEKNRTIKEENTSTESSNDSGTPKFASSYENKTCFFDSRNWKESCLQVNIQSPRRRPSRFRFQEKCPDEAEYSRMKIESSAQGSKSRRPSITSNALKSQVKVLKEQRKPPESAKLVRKFTFHNFGSKKQRKSIKTEKEIEGFKAQTEKLKSRFVDFLISGMKKGSKNIQVKRRLSIPNMTSSNELSPASSLAGDGQENSEKRRKSVTPKTIIIDESQGIMGLRGEPESPSSQSSQKVSSQSSRSSKKAYSGRKSARSGLYIKSVSMEEQLERKRIVREILATKDGLLKSDRSSRNDGSVGRRSASQQDLGKVESIQKYKKMSPSLLSPSSESEDGSQSLIESKDLNMGRSDPLISNEALLSPTKFHRLRPNKDLFTKDLEAFSALLKPKHFDSSDAESVFSADLRKNKKRKRSSASEKGKDGNLSIAQPSLSRFSSEQKGSIFSKRPNLKVSKFARFGAQDPLNLDNEDQSNPGDSQEDDEPFLQEFVRVDFGSNLKSKYDRFGEQGRNYTPQNNNSTSQESMGSGPRGLSTRIQFLKSKQLERFETISVRRQNPYKPVENVKTPPNLNLAEPDDSDKLSADMVNFFILNHI